MSPFVSLLLALAALLPTAHGLCRPKHVGETTETWVDYNRVDFYPPGATIDLHVNYCPPLMRVVGEDITACNNDRSGTAPIIDGPNHNGDWSFNVECSEWECPTGGYVDIRQYCDYV